MIPLLDRVYVLDKQNRVWELNFLNEPVIENLLPGTRAQKRDVIFHGLSFVMGKLELVWLMNNLKCHRSVISLAVDLSKDRENVRKIIERNKEMMRVLEKANIVLF